MSRARWSAAQAADWAAREPWRAGVNYLPASAINQIEMWAAETFDPTAIAQELDWAANLGFSTLRVYLHDESWRVDREGFRARVTAVLQIAAARGIAPLLVIFDDCWHEPRAGVQPAPRAGVHNSGWARSPGRARLLDPAAWPELESYVRDLARWFGADPRILGWDVYNEVTNLYMPAMSLPAGLREPALAALALEKPAQDEAALQLLELAFSWLRAEGVAQPLTAGEYTPNAAYNARLAELSDIVSFHHYRSAESLTRQLARMAAYGRPVWCTEFLNRREGCTFQTHLPVFKAAGVSCWSWGLVDGKSQTKWAWSDPEGGPAPAVWFHDLLHSDGAPYDPEEAAFLRRMIKGP